MKTFFIYSTLSLAFLMTSCGMAREATQNHNQQQTEVVLAKNNYKVIGTVKGESKQTYVFGIGGMSKKSLNQSALTEMYKNANLTGSQAVINVTIQYKNKMITPLYIQSKAIAYGTVIEFTE